MLTTHQAELTIEMLAEVDFDNGNDELCSRIDAYAAIKKWRDNPEVFGQTGYFDEDIREAMEVLGFPALEDCYRNRILQLQEEQYQEIDENAVHVSQLPDESTEG
jgi:hypothetical protein